MCHNHVEKFRCGHEDKTFIPCEGLCETGTCSGPEADQSQDNDELKCTKCKYAAAENDFLQNELYKFTMEESLKEPAAPVIRDPNAPKKYFKWCIEWERCKHRSHPRPSDLERNDNDDEYLTISGIGQCYDCSTAPASKIADMKQSGDYENKDAWGALSRVEVAEGSSKDPSLQSLEEIAGHHPSYKRSDEHQQTEPDSPVGRLPSADRDEQQGTTEDSDDDTGAAKGKGRAGEPLVHRGVEGEAESDDAEESDEEGQAELAKKKAAEKMTKKAMQDEDDKENGDEDEDEDNDDKEEGTDESDEEDGKPAPPPDWSAESSSHPLEKQAASKAVHRTEDVDNNGEDQIPKANGVESIAQKE
ncbi:MAG: hypothetical protein Q9205_000323 [Flavoplaca limonia]